MTEATNQAVTTNLSAPLPERVEQYIGSTNKYEPPPLLKPETLALVPAWIQEREEALKPAPGGEIGILVTTLMTVLPFRDGIDAEAFILALAEDLAEYPAVCIRDAIRDIRRKNTFWPSIAEIIGAVQERRRQRRARIDRLRWLKAAQNHPPRDGVPDDTWLAEINVMVRRGLTEPPKSPPPASAPEVTGIMRAPWPRTAASEPVDMKAVEDKIPPAARALAKKRMGI